MSEAVGILKDMLNSWRRGPYPYSVSYVSAMEFCTDAEPRWIRDVQNIVDLADTMQALTYRQREVLYRYVVMGQGMRQIAGVMFLSERAVGAELEIVLKELIQQISEKVSFTSVFPPI